MWQVASELSYRCWDGKQHVPLTDYLISPNNNASDISAQEGPIFGDSSPISAARPAAGGPAKLSPGGIAGVVIGVLIGVGLIAGLIYFVGFKRLYQEKRATSFKPFEVERRLSGVGDITEGVAGPHVEGVPPSRPIHM
eukprot:jgi/Chrzof1/8586/Cz03g16140.t1